MRRCIHHSTRVHGSRQARRVRVVLAASRYQASASLCTLVPLVRRGPSSSLALIVLSDSSPDLPSSPCTRTRRAEDPDPTRRDLLHHRPPGVVLDCRGRGSTAPQIQSEGNRPRLRLSFSSPYGGGMRQWRPWCPHRPTGPICPSPAARRFRCRRGTVHRLPDLGPNGRPPRGPTSVHHRSVESPTCSDRGHHRRGREGPITARAARVL